MNRITRRELLGGATAIGAIAVSGCVARPEDVFGGTSGPTDSEDDPGDADDGTTHPGDADDGTTHPGDADDGTTDLEDASVTDAAGIDAASIETVETRCGSPDDDEITVQKDAKTVIIDGVLPAPNPCHEGVLDAGSVDDATLSLAVDVADTTADGEGCVMCHGAVSYRAEIELGDVAPIESVVVDHETGDRHSTNVNYHTGDRHTTDADHDDTDTAAPIESTSIETLEAGCGTGDEEDVTVDFGDEAITVTGTLPAPNPCHEAVFGPVSLDDDQLSVVVEVRSTLEEGEMCIECLGAVAYTARIVPSNPAAIERVTVDHASVTGTESTIPP